MKRNAQINSGYGVWGIGYRHSSTDISSDTQANKYNYRKSDLEILPQTPNPIPQTPEIKCDCRKKGFGILEVIVAALVLGFMFLALNVLQKGNRESILRVRARDAASVIAQEIIDSISALGPASVAPFTTTRSHEFRGQVGNVEMQYTVDVGVIDAEDTGHVVDNQTDYMQALAASSQTDQTGKISVAHQIAKQVDVTVTWKFKSSDQSINISSLVR